MATAVIALGSNLGDRAANLRQALDRLGAVLEIERVSSLYETDPVGYADQPPFLNAVALGRTTRPPLDLLHALQRIESDLGRTRPFADAPRTLDLDLLLYDDTLLDTPELILPHPRMHERFFVLVPLAEIAPDLRHPHLGATIGELLARLGTPAGIRRIAGPEWAGEVADRSPNGRD
jgi:2-amino-4-hydroxy-6-hydroxymethyldihydropteridine diphosphokinase